MRNVLILMAVFMGQNNSPLIKDKTTICDDYKSKSSECISRYYADNDSKHIDSALYLVNKGLKSCEKYQGLFTSRKLCLLSLKQEYDLALSFIDSLNKDLFSDLPFYQRMLKYRFLAMKAQANNDYELRNSYLNFLIKDINVFLADKKTEVDALIKQSDSNKIFSNPLSTALTQYYYYKSIVEGKEKIENELNSQQRKNNVNKDFFEYLIASLDEDFMVFIGM